MKKLAMVLLFLIKVLTIRPLRLLIDYRKPTLREGMILLCTWLRIS